jgi:hypothetical protein
VGFRKANMIHTKVQYNAYNRTFKLVDKDLGALLEDYGLYDLGIPLQCDELDIDDFTSHFETQIPRA